MSKKEKKDTKPAEQTVSETTDETVEIEIDTETITKELQAVIAKKNEELAASDDKYKRLVAEYDNFKKRSIKEKLQVQSLRFSRKVRISWMICCVALVSIRNVCPFQ